jgi:MacB-like periplasmic core domain
MRVHCCLQTGIVHAAGLLVPHAARAEWLREWRAEVWHAREQMRNEGELTQVCLGAWQDALCVRRITRERSEGAPSSRSRGFAAGSAMRCLLAMAAVLAVSYGLARVLPGVRAQSSEARWRMNPGLILIEDGTTTDDSVATIPAETYRDWKGRRQRFFDGFAFYRMQKERTATGQWRVAHASENLFWLLGVPLHFMEGNGDAPGVVLSDAVWRREFGANAEIVGSVVRVGGRAVRVIGVAAEGAWRLPGAADAWVLEPDEENKGVGYVVAHLTKLGQAAMPGWRVEITPANGDDANAALNGVSFAERTRGPWGMYEFAILLAFLALPAITSVSLGEYNFSEHRPSWTTTARRWGFLAAKIALLLPAVYFTSLDAAYWNTMTYSIPAQYVQLLASFSMCLFGLRWALLDQRQRCPVCLRRVTNPAHVGLAGRTFLAWNGTEMICTSGHTLLHVPGLPTSWFSTQRWMYLDTSWKFLFEIAS